MFALVVMCGTTARIKTENYGPRVLIEPWNEPQYWGPTPPTSDFAALQKKTYDRIRVQDATRPVVLTGPCSSWIYGLPNVSASPYAGDANVFWTFHWYGPRNEVSFTHQRADWVGNRPFLNQMAGLRWPEQPARKAKFIADFKLAAPGNDTQIDASITPFLIFRARRASSLPNLLRRQTGAQAILSLPIE